MEVNDGKTSFDNYRDAHQHAANIRVNSERAFQAMPGVDLEILPEPTKELTDYFFSLQSQVEGEGDMDYHKYASQMWGKFFGEPTSERDGEAFSYFENRMIASLHSIDMRKLVYPHVTENLESLIDIRGDQVDEIILWSTGDVAATGYQAGKIDKSGVIPAFLRALAKRDPGKVRERAQKTRYMVDDNKFDRLVEHTAETKKDGEQMKIVIIEDSVKNFEKVRTALEERFGKDVVAREFQINPIWAAYSREGLTAQQKAEGSQGEWGNYMARRRALNAIDSFAELLDPRFNDMFSGAHVFCDFDGVIGNNIEMREEQAKVIFHALTEGALKKGLTLGGFDQRVKEALTPAA